jgi:hypothetical protein
MRKRTMKASLLHVALSLPFVRFATSLSIRPLVGVTRTSVAAALRLSSSPTPTDQNDNSISQWQGKDIYQRVFYRFSPGSDVSIPQALVVEERCRFVADPNRPDYIIPIGPRTLILRDGQVEDGEIGDDFFTMQCQTAEGVAKTHNGAGNDSNVQASIACALYLAANPELCRGRVLEIACQSGLASLLGCIAAGYTLRRSSGSSDTQDDDPDDDILTISNKKDALFPTELDVLVLTDVAESDLAATALANLKAAGVSGKKVALNLLDWRVRGVPAPRGQRRTIDEYRTIVGSDFSFSYPETKELARTVANRLLPTAPFLYASAATTPLPRFVYVCPDGRDDVPYLRRMLEKGYRMTTSMHYLKVEKLTFAFQKLLAGEPETALDDLELELQDFREIKYESLVAQHHFDYKGEGSGELFFPIETGEYEATGGSTFLEKEAGSSPW